MQIDILHLHAVRSSHHGGLLSETLFKPMPPTPEDLIAVAANLFSSEFFTALKTMLLELETGSGYVQQLLDIPLQDAAALHSALTGARIH